MNEKVIPYLWFRQNAKEAVDLYVSVFRDSKILSTTQLENVPGPEGETYTITFTVKDLKFVALNGGPAEGYDTFSGATSFMVECADQAEVDEYWDKLSEEGTPGPCGWIADKYGLSWQIVPKLLGELIGNSDREAANRAVQAMLKMGKIDCQQLQRAFDGS